MLQSSAVPSSIEWNAARCESMSACVMSGTVVGGRVGDSLRAAGIVPQ
jgi:hypothetical protein